MFLQNKESEVLIKVMDLESLFSPLDTKVEGRSQAGEEEQPPRLYDKQQLAFPSGEELPQCWLDKDYRKKSA